MSLHLVLFLFVSALSIRKGDRIYVQQKAMGCALDWERACFTMDPVCHNARARNYS